MIALPDPMVDDNEESIKTESVKSDKVPNISTTVERALETLAFIPIFTPNLKYISIDLYLLRLFTKVNPRNYSLTDNPITVIER